MTETSLPTQKQNTGWVVFAHALIVILIWTSPFLFRWQLIVLGIILYYLQIIFLGDCVLTRRQFDIKKRSVTFYYFILTKIGFRPDMYRVRFIADYIMPPIILAVSLILQLALTKQPLLY